METNPPVNVACCALRQIQVGDLTTKEYLKECMDHTAKAGWRAVLVIQKEVETNLAANLKELGFAPIQQFPRRREYPNTMLTMWFKILD